MKPLKEHLITESKVIPKSLLKEWSKMTDYNNHTEVRLEIAKYFKYDEFVQIYQSILKHEEKLKGMTMKDAELRYETTQEMINLIKQDYGTDVANQVYSCL